MHGLAMGRMIRRKIRKRNIITAVIVAIGAIYFLFLRVQYVRPSGLVKELFPGEEYVPYVTMKFSNGFRYPLELDIQDIAKRKIQGEAVNVQVINPHPFRYIYNPKNLCFKFQKNRGLHLLILVKSAASHVELRHVIRSTWGRKIKEGNHFGLAFLLGYSDLHQYIIDKENQFFDDIVQEDFLEAYLNNTHKTIMAYNWVVEYCSHARMVLFLDDDAYLNFDLLNDYLKTQSNRNVVSLFSGNISPFVETCRVRGLPWYMSWSDFPYDRYPDYLQGVAIFASMSVVKLFQAVFPYVRFFPLDDVFLGIVAYKLNITLDQNPYMEKSISNYYEHIANGNKKYHDHVSDLIVAHGFDDPSYYLQTYNRLSNMKYHSIAVRAHGMQRNVVFLLFVLYCVWNFCVTS